jgi:selenocysteine lyase/cysteine desulfurase
MNAFQPPLKVSPFLLFRHESRLLKGETVISLPFMASRVRRCSHHQIEGHAVNLGSSDFDLPKGTTYLNCAFTSPLLKSAEAAGHAAVSMKRTPWKVTPEHFLDPPEEPRQSFAQIIGAQADDIALIPAVSYGVATAARHLTIGTGKTIIVLEDQFPSHVYSWRCAAERKGARIVTVPRPGDDDWTSAVLEHLDEQTAVAALPNCHWTDGSRVDLKRIGEACREMGAALVVDGTQSVGAMPFDVKSVQPDYLICSGHKWLLGPYSYSYMYVAPKHQLGEPLEENWLNRRDSRDFSKLTCYCDEYREGARRFDVGEVSNFFLTPIAAVALQQILDWGVENIAAAIKPLSDAVAEKARSMGAATPHPDHRSPHLTGLRLPQAPPDDITKRLAKHNVYVSRRSSTIRISPHIYNTMDDIERFFAVLKDVL